MPVAGSIQYLKEPGGPGVRVDSALYPGAQITPEYDSLLAKVITWGDTRRAAIQRMRCALGDYQVGGIPTDREFLLQIIESPEFISGQFTTTYLEHFQPAEAAPENELEREMALAAVLYLQQCTTPATTSPSSSAASQWTNTAWREQMRGPSY
jgi:acetyl/propionyl-CoA carboxylase alpha subunit